MTHLSHFAQSYAEARAKFLDAARGAGATLQAHLHAARAGFDGEALAMDVARLGPASASRVLLVASGTHGVEGFCGSGCQVAMLRERTFEAFPEDCAVVLVHAVNPFGFSHLRRVNEDNVDCNRNFIDHAQAPANPAYDEVHLWLVPDDWDGPARAAADEAIADYIATRGLTAFQIAATGGQYRHPEGLFFGGHAPVWSNRTFRQMLGDHARACSELVFIDLHTGLGPSGHGEAIFIGEGGGAEHRRAVEMFGDDVTSISQGTSTSAPVTGVLADAVREEAVQAQVTNLALEYGTYPVERVLSALRADNWLHMRGKSRPDLAPAMRREARDAFYVDEADWKDAVAERALQLAVRVGDSFADQSAARRS